MTKNCRVFSVLSRNFQGFLGSPGCNFAANASNLQPIRGIPEDGRTKSLQSLNETSQGGWQTIAKATNAKSGKAKAPSKSEVLNNLAAATELSRKQIAAVLEALTADINKSLGKKGNGVYQIPGLC